METGALTFLLPPACILSSFFFHVLGKRVLQLQVAHRSKRRDRLNGRILAQLTFANFALKCNNIYSDWCVTIDIFISIEHL